MSEEKAAPGSCSSRRCDSKHAIEEEMSAYTQATRAIYSEDVDAFKAAIFSDPAILSQYEQGYALIHHIAVADSDAVFAAYTSCGGDISIRTKSFFFNFSAAPLFHIGGQTALHVSMSHHCKSEIYKAILAPHLSEFEETEDVLGNLPEAYSDRSASFFAQCFQQLKSIASKYNDSVLKAPEGVVQGEWVPADDSFRTQFFAYVNSLPIKPPNSMHKTGRVLTESQEGIKLVKTAAAEIFKATGTCQDVDLNKCNVFAFTAEYECLGGEPFSSTKKELVQVPIVEGQCEQKSEAVCGEGRSKQDRDDYKPEEGQRKLGLHRDHSTITLNWNFECSEDIQGCELVFVDVDGGLALRPRLNSVCIHSGQLRHLVQRLEKGQRKNLIIWLRPLPNPDM